MKSSSLRGRHPSASQHKLDVRFTPKADMCSATSDVRFGPKADMRNDRVRSLGLCFAISPMTQRDRLTKVTLPYRATIELNDHAVGRVNRAFVPIFDPETIRRKPIDPSSRWACCWAHRKVGQQCDKVTLGGKLLFPIGRWSNAHAHIRIAGGLFRYHARKRTLNGVSRMSA